MKLCLRSALAVTTIAFFPFCKNPATIEKKPALLPVEDFFKDPESMRWRISPNGAFVSYLAPYRGHNNIFIRKIGDKGSVRITRDTMRNIREYQWKADRVLYLQDVGGDENYQLFSATVDGNEVKPLTPFPKVKTLLVDDLHGVPGREKEIIVAINKRDRRYFDPFLLNIESGELKLLYKNDRNFDSWFTDHTGTIRMASKSDGVNVTWFHRSGENEPFDSLFTTNYTETFTPQLFTFDNGSLFALSNLGRDKMVAVEYDLKARKEVREIYSHPDYDLDQLLWSPRRQLLTRVSYTSWKRDDHFLDTVTQSVYDALKKKFRGYEVNLLNNDDAESKFVVSVSSDKQEGRYYLYDRTDGRTRYLNAVSPWLKEEDMAEMKPIEYLSRDSLVIHGYLTLPKGVPPANLPVVINPHGGPWNRDKWGFNQETQLLANRGYAVLQMNFRASIGYGKAFMLKGNKEWGKKIQDDITDGVQWLIRQGIADPKRVAIYGASFGGYATLAGLTFSPDLYRCGIDYVGPSNLFTFYKTIPLYWKPYLEMIHEMVGDPQKDSLLLAEISPLLHVERIKAPLFIAQGANDPRVGKQESDQMVAALQKRGIEVSYMVKNDEGHGFINTQNQIEFYKRMDTFLIRHLAP